MPYGPFQHGWPYSNFHDLNLDWVLKTVRNLADEWKQVQTDWTTQQEAFDSLKKYIENYFKNLDVQDEINEKINDLVESGEFLDIIQSTVESVTQSSTDDWLRENMTPGAGAPALDSSLTLANAAAQAKAVGDKCPQVNAFDNKKKNFDFNDYKTLGFYWLYWNPSIIATNSPFEPASSGTNTLLFVHSRGGTDVAQIAVNMNPTATPKIASRRLSSAGWGDWGHDLSVDDVNNTVNTTVNTAVNDAALNAALNPGVSMFDTIAVIGDSLSVGYNQNKGGTVVRPVFKQSWPQYLVKLYGTTVYWCGFSGATTKSFLDDNDTTASASGRTPRGMTYTENIGPKALYIIQLGVNDAQKVELGTPSDVGTNNETFYGMLSKIVENVHSLAPNAFALVATPILNIPDGFEDAIKYVGEHYQYSGFVDFRPYISGLADLVHAGHYTELGYYKAGAAMNAACGLALSNNKFLYVNDANNNATTPAEINPYD